MEADGVGGGPSCEPTRVVPRLVVVEAGLFVALFAGVAVAFGAGFDGAVGGSVGAGAVGVVFFVGDDLGVFAEL